MKQLQLSLILILACVYINTSQDKCSSSTNLYLCDPGFENNLQRSGIPFNDSVPYAISNSWGYDYYFEVNRCLGGPADTFWNNRCNYYPLPSGVNPPDFLSWFQPTCGTSDYFHRNAKSPDSIRPIDKNVRVPRNFMGLQEPSEGQGGNGYIGIALSFNNENGFEYREYVESKLKQPLLVNQTYNVSIRVSKFSIDSTLDTSIINESISDICVYFTSSSFTISDNAVHIPVTNSTQLLCPHPDSTLDKDGMYQNNSGSHWMTVSGNITIADSNKNYIIIGNFQNNLDFVNGIYPPFNGTFGKLYYYIDGVQITQAAMASPCFCEFNQIRISPTSSQSNDSLCCYDIFIKSAPVTCKYNEVVITDIESQYSQTFSSVDTLLGYPRNNQEYTLTTSFCIIRPDDGDRVKLKFDFWGTDSLGNPVLVCTKSEYLVCECDCNRLTNYKYNEKIKVFTVRTDNECCFEIYIENNSNCVLPYNVLSIDYLGENFGDLNIENMEQGWSHQVLQNGFRLVKNNPKSIFPNDSPQKIGKFCVDSNGVMHPLKITLGYMDDEEFIACYPDTTNWIDSIKCERTDEDCCDLLHSELIPYTPPGGNMASTYGPLCYWNVRLWQDHDPDCPVIDKIILKHYGKPLDDRELLSPSLNSGGLLVKPPYSVIRTEYANGYSANITIYVNYYSNDILMCSDTLTDTCSAYYTPYPGKIGNREFLDQSIFDLDNFDIFPNPFNDEQYIGFTLKEEQFVRIEIFDNMGRKNITIFDEFLMKGYHQKLVVSDGLTSGSYYLKIFKKDGINILPILKLK